MQQHLLHEKHICSAGEEGTATEVTFGGHGERISRCKRLWKVWRSSWFSCCLSLCCKYHFPALCYPQAASFSMEKASQAPGMWLVARLSLCHKYKGFSLLFLTFCPDCMLWKFRAVMEIWHEGEHLVWARFLVYFLPNRWDRQLLLDFGPQAFLGDWCAPCFHGAWEQGVGQFIVLGIFLWNIYRGTIFLCMVAHAIQMIKMPF